MRYFIEVAYKGTRYAGFQVQQNAITVQQELEQALATFFKQPISLTGSSRTDAGVHALQNYFQMDVLFEVLPKQVYNLNAMLPKDIVIRKIFGVKPDLHCRFHATHRNYRYSIYHQKDPFLDDRAWYYPYPVDVHLLHQAAAIIKCHSDFTSFSKRNTQTFTKLCTIIESRWETAPDLLIYHVKANRFLRGMVRALVATQLMVGRRKISLQQFEEIIRAKDPRLANFAAPAHGLVLMEVGLPVGI